MDLFTIQCTTCRARLKVKDESVIGDILACPKCGSMVQVVPPVGWSRSMAIGAVVSAAAPPPVESWPPSGAASQGATSPVATTQPTATQPAVTQSAVSQPPLAQPAVAVPPALPSRSVSRPSAKSAATARAKTGAAESLSAKSAAAIVEPTPPAIATPANGAPIAGITPDALPLGTGLMTRIKADWMLYGGGLAAGALLGACVWLFIAMQDSAPVTVATDAPTNVALAPTPKAPSGRAADSPIVEPPTQPSTTTAESADADAAKLAAETTQPAGEPPAENTTADSDRPMAPKTAAAEQPDSDAAADARPAPAKAPSPAIKLDPIQKAAATTPSDSTTTEDGSTAPSAADVATSPRPLARPAAAASESAGSPSTPSLSKAQIEERLTVALPTVAFVKVPLAQFVDFIGDFTALPITIDDLALAKVGKKRQTPVTVQLSDATAREALDAAVKPLGLTCVVRGSRLVVTAGGAAAAAK